MRPTPPVTWAALVVAALVVVASVLAVGARTRARVQTRECRGQLEVVPSDGSGIQLRAMIPTDLVVKWDDVPVPTNINADAMYANVRVVWQRSDGIAACSDLPLPWPEVAGRGESPSTTTQFAKAVSGDVHVVYVRGKAVVFRKVETAGERKVFEEFGVVHVAAIFIVIAALGLLGVGVKRAMSATPYARMIRWQEGVLRADGLVEGTSGGSVGVLAKGVDLLVGPVLVDPRAVEGRAVYRALPVIERDMIVVGSHVDWRARSRHALLAATVIAAAASGLAGVAYLLAR